MSKVNDLFKKELKVANIGLETFYEANKDQDIKTIQIEWKPPAGGDPKLIEILNKLK